MPHRPNQSLPPFCSLQYRTINVKTAVSACRDLILQAFAEVPNARYAWCEHPAEGDTPAHFHLVASFSSPRRFSLALERLHMLDGHEYVRPCRNFRGSVRYLCHLDNPEKVQIPPSQIHFEGDWEGVNLATLLEPHRAGLDLQSLLKHVSTYCSLHSDTASGMSREYGSSFRPLQFAVWLDACGIDSKKVFNMVRTMGISWGEIVSESEIIDW